jgi:hypothetical protein
MLNFVIERDWARLPVKGALKTSLACTCGNNSLVSLPSFIFHLNCTVDVSRRFYFCIAENWKRRIEIVDYCVAVVDQSVEEKQKHVDDLQEDPAAQRRKQAEMFADEVKVGLSDSENELSHPFPVLGHAQRNQIHNEIAVEKIVRQRSLDGTH